ncbi:hypothetical protein BKA04_000437 [Cryobacterium mesophilum]|uniref:Uncharacterized protein n=1 Tax=Terrimesophilobacter mesophilus TaxID=433647 RepID=A0A4R8V8P1_9MICO|nr:hypothetical protein [Terrimesophilobacter mesophilus]MBB5632214.1 hypothetical protein [Terrimesophilobacter mesophilus]TFB79073.1 hypothetical protein E3N84_02750 [Terrimesophilobacter mesophilus]
MTAFAAIAATVVLGLLAVFQLALVAGAPLGHLAWGGQSRVLPTRLRIGSVVSIAIYALIAAVLLERAGLIRLFGDPGLVQVAVWVVFAYFALGILLNAISRSTPERYTMVPVTLVLAALSLVVALG